MKSPLYPKTNDCGGSQYDPHTQFLEEAKLHAKEISIFQTSSVFSEEYEEKKKKSWKNLLLPWWKVVDKKSKSQVEPSTNFRASNKRNSVSGPVHSNNTVKSTDNKQKFSTSGPLTSLFNSSRKADNEISYMCLDQLGCPNPNIQTYGPVYLVT